MEIRIIFGVFYILLVITAVIMLWLYHRNEHVFTNRLEGEVNSRFVKIAKKLGGLEMYDIMLEYGGNTTQIDNILLTQKAMYVVEAKDYSGWVFGSESSKYWTQTFPTEKYQFYNPIMQNQTHINILNKLTNVNKLIPVFNIIVFGNSVEFKDVTCKSDVRVIYLYQLKSTIYKLDKNIEKSIQSFEQAKIVDAIFFLNIEDKNRRMEHIERLKSKYGTH